MKKFNELPQTPWAAKSLWEIETKSLLVLCFSLSLLGIGDGLLVLSNLGSAPWTVLSQGIALQAQFSVGWASFIVSILVMLMWIPLRLKVGFGTILNVVLIALFLGLSIFYISPPSSILARFCYLITGIIFFGIGTAFYLTCHQGAGPRDGLMVGLCHRFKLRIGIVRTLMEVSVCFLGFLLGGTVGIGTLLFATSIGWIIQLGVYFIMKLNKSV